MAYFFALSRHTDKLPHLEPRIQRVKDSKPPGFKDARIQALQDSRIQAFKDSRAHRWKDPAIHVGAFVPRATASDFPSSIPSEMGTFLNEDHGIWSEMGTSL